MKAIITSFIGLFSICSIFAQPQAYFEWEDTDAGCSPYVIQFINASIGENLAYDWSYPAAVEFDTETLIGLFPETESYQVCLTATDQIAGTNSTFCSTLHLLFYQDTLLHEVAICPGEVIQYAGSEITAPGYYNFTLAGQGGCDSNVVLAVSELPAAITDYTDYICDGESIVVNGTTYDTANPNGTEIFAGASSSGCDSIVNIDLLQGLQLSGNSTGDLMPGNSVLLEVSAANGQAPFTYSWFDEIGTDLGNAETLTVDQEGEYTVVVIDDAGCTNEHVFIVGPFEDLIITLEGSPEICEGSLDGFIAVTSVENGIGPYIYEWNTGGFGSIITNLSAGTYCVTATDAMENTGVACLAILEMAFEIMAEVTHSTCNQDGSISLEVTGTPPFQYVWSNNQFGQVISNLSPGEYSVTVVDQNGCFATQSYTIDDDDFDYDISINTADCDQANGSIFITGDLVMNYLFEWSNGAQTDSVFNLSEGGYAVTISDPALGCTKEEVIILDEAPECYALITGHIWNADGDPSCLPNNNSGVAFVKVELSDGQITFADADGFYSFAVNEAGNYTIGIDLTGNLIFEPICVGDIEVTVDAFDTELSNNDFYVDYTDYADLQVYLSKGNARPGFIHTVSVALVNAGATVESGSLQFIHPAEQEYTGGSPEPDNYDLATGTVTWNFTAIEQGETFNHSVTLLTPVGTGLGVPLLYQALTNDPADDALPANNMASCEIITTGSYDPNDKSVLPMGEGAQGFIDQSLEQLTYQIRFQNTGTDTAFTVVIRDTLDANLDVSSMQPLGASHAFRTNIPESNVVEFVFENILLPDSTINEPASHGYVMFSINLKTDLPFNSEIRNRAGIYFDFNEPIITNEVLNTIAPPDAVFNPEANLLPITIQPNPTGDFAKAYFELKDPATLSIKVLSVDGRQFHEQTNGSYSAGKQSLDVPVKDLPAGIYYLVMEDEAGRLGQTKFVKL